VSLSATWKLSRTSWRQRNTCPSSVRRRCVKIGSRVATDLETERFLKPVKERYDLASSFNIGCEVDFGALMAQGPFADICAKSTNEQNELNSRSKLLNKFCFQSRSS